MFVLAPSTGATRLLDATALTYTTAVAGASPVKNGSAAMYLPGKILTTGGGPVGGASVTDSAILDMTQSAPSWQSVAPMAYPRYMHKLTVMPDGKVFAVGGSTIVDQAVTTGSRTPEMWDPPTQTWTQLAPEANERMYHSTSVLLPEADRRRLHIPASHLHGVAFATGRGRALNRDLLVLSREKAYIVVAVVHGQHNPWLRCNLG